MFSPSVQSAQHDTSGAIVSASEPSGVSNEKDSGDATSEAGAPCHAIMGWRKVDDGDFSDQHVIEAFGQVFEPTAHWEFGWAVDVV